MKLFNRVRPTDRNDRKLATKELSDDLLSQIAGGAAKVGCHTVASRD